MIESKIYERDRELFEAIKALPEEVRQQITVASIPFNIRAQTVFKRIGIRNLGQLQEKSRFDLMREQGMGELSYNQVAFFMQELGLPMALVSTDSMASKEDTRTLRDLIAQMRDLLTKMEAKLQ